MVVVGQKLKNRSQKMSQVQSGGEDGMVDTEVGPVDDETAETEVDFRPSRGSDRVPEDRPIITGAVAAEADERDPGRTRLLRSLGGAKPKRPRDGLPIPRTPGPRKPPPGAGTQPGKSVTDRFSFDMPTPMYPGSGRQPPGAGTQPVTNQYAFEMPTQTNPGPGRQPPGAGTQPATERFT